MKRMIAIAAFCFGFATSASSQSYPSRNECGDLPGATEFLRELTTAVANRDETMLLGLTAPDVLLDFGGGTGRALLRERLSDQDYMLWEALDELLLLGCVGHTGESLSLPWYFAQDIGSRDPFGTYIATGASVPLYRSAVGSKIVRNLNWEMVLSVAYIEQVEETGPRMEVRLRDGTRGFVEEDWLRSLIDYRLFAEPGEDGWLIRTFVAGD